MPIAASFAIGEEAYTGDGMLINSGFLDGLSVEAAKTAIADALTKKKVKGRAAAERQTQYRLRDWGTPGSAIGKLPIYIIHRRRSRHRAGAGEDLPALHPVLDVSFDKPGKPPDRHQTWQACHLPELLCPGGALDAHDGQRRRPACNPRAVLLLHLQVCRPTRRRRLLGRRSTNISAA